MDREEFIRSLEERHIIDKRQITKARISPYTSCSSANEYSVCSMVLEGIGNAFEADIVTVQAIIHGKTVKQAEVPVAPDDVEKLILTLPQETAGRFAGTTEECTVTLRDKYGRKIVSSIFNLEFGGKTPEPVISAKAVFQNALRTDEESVFAKVADLRVSTDRDTTVSIDLSADEKSVWHSNINLLSGSEINLEISPAISELNGPGKVTFLLQIECNGNTVFKESCPSEIIGEVVQPAPTTECRIFGGMEIPEYIDTHTAEKDMVTLGTLELFNKGEETDLSVSLSVDGNLITHSRVRMPEFDYSLKIEAPFNLLAKETTHVSELSADVTDEDGNQVLHQTIATRIRSKYELDLNNLCVRTAQFVNPRNAAVMKLIEDSGGPLAKAMPGRYSIEGYQHKGIHVVNQMKAIYDMLHKQKFRYVSDTFSFNSSEKAYQHVRTPDRILRDNSGNCLEISILFASLLEAMDLEPVIAFPPGHAIVGVVLHTNIYLSSSDYTEIEEIPYVTMETPEGKADIMFIEATACPWDDNFVDAVCLAYKTITDKMDTVRCGSNHIFIKKARQKGIDPIPEL